LLIFHTSTENVDLLHEHRNGDTLYSLTAVSIMFLLQANIDNQSLLKFISSPDTLL